MIFFCVNLSIIYISTVYITDSSVKVGTGVLWSRNALKEEELFLSLLKNTQAKDGRKPLAQHRELAGLDVCLM